MPSILPMTKTSKIGGGRLGSLKGSDTHEKVLESHRSDERSVSSSNIDSQLKLDINDIKLTFDEGASMTKTPKIMNVSQGKKDNYNKSLHESEFSNSN